jgi:hypothetical protein
MMNASAPLVVPYREFRREARDGDVVLFQGTGLLSRIIRKGSGSEYSHAGMVAWWGDRLVLLQSTGRGVETLPMSRAVRDYAGPVDWFQVRPDLEERLDRERLLSMAVCMQGIPYGTSGLLYLAFRMLLERMGVRSYRNDPDMTGRPDRLFCSQYIAACFEAAGIDLDRQTPHHFTSPGDLAFSRSLVRRGTLVPQPEDCDRCERLFREGEARRLSSSES